MNTHFLTTTYRTVLFGCLILLGYAFFGIASAEAASVMLAVNGVGTVSVDSGSSVTLSWQASGVTGCSINNGIGAVALTGSRPVVPPNAGATYTITCSGLTDSATIQIKPYVTLWSTPLTVTPAVVGNPGPVTINWNAINATQCTLMTARGVTTGVTRTLFSTARPATSNISDSISEATVYTITCNNPQNGLSRTGTHTVNYGAPGAPLIVSFGVENYDSNTIPWDPEWAGAHLEIKFDSTNSTKCVRSAYYTNGTAYTLSGWTAAQSGTASNWTTAGFHTVIATSSTLRLKCGRVSDNLWDQEDILFTLLPRPATTTSATVTANLIAPPSVSVPQASNLPARVSVQTISDNANGCKFFAYDAVTNATTTVSGWTDRLTDWFRRNGTFDILLTQSTRLLYECTRTSDGRIARDSETVTVTVTSSQPPAVTLAATPAGISSNVQTVRLSWVGSNVNLCQGTDVIQGGVVTDNWFTSGTVPLSGVKTVSVYSNTRYAIACLNTITSQMATATVDVGLVDGEVVVASVVVDVDDGSGGGGNSTGTPPTQAQINAYKASTTITASPNLLRRTETTTVSWTAPVALIAGCRLYEGNTAVPLVVSATSSSGVVSGSFASQPIKAERVFTIDCQIPNASESASVSASVKVLPKIIES